MASDDEDIPETGAIFTFGKTRFAENLANKFWIRDDKVLQLACGDEHSAVITSSGRLYTFGSNDWGQLGHGNTKPYTKPSVVKRLKGDKVRLVACGRSHTLVIAESGVFSFGAGSDSQLGHGDSKSYNVPTQIEYFNNEVVIKADCGAEHSAAVTEAGQLYMWGSSNEGQLGLGISEREHPTHLKFRSKVVSVACGYYHTAVVTENGKLFTFGENEGGKLGLEEQQCYNNEEPQQVKTLLNEHVSSVACGASHTVVLTKRGSVYTFGYGMHGQLGHGPSLQDVSLPKLVTALQKKIVTAVSCGDSHTAILTRKGELFTCGDGRHGKLGMGDESFSNLFKPERVTRFKGFRVDHVACGGCHMLAAAAKNEEGNGESEESEEDMVATRVVASESAADVVDGDVEISPRLSATIPPSGLSARDKRRQRDLENTTLGGSLPPLNRSSLPPLASLGISNIKKEEPTKATSNGAFNPLDRSTLPTISLKEPSADENDESSEKETLHNSTNTRRLPPRPKRRQKEPEPESESEDDDGKTTKHDANKTVRPKPLPRKRKTTTEIEKENEAKTKVQEEYKTKNETGSDASAEDSEDDDDIGDKTRDTSEVPSASRSLAEAKQSERIETKDGKEDEDSEEDEETEDEEGDEYEEEDEDDEEDEDEEENEKSKEAVEDKDGVARKKSESKITKVEQLGSGASGGDDEDEEDEDEDREGDKKKKGKYGKNKDKDSKKDDKEEDKKKTKEKKKREKGEQDKEKEEDENKNEMKISKSKDKKKEKDNDAKSDEEENETKEVETEDGKEEEGKGEVAETNDTKENEGETEENGKEDDKGDDIKGKEKNTKKSRTCVLL